MTKLTNKCLSDFLGAKSDSPEEQMFNQKLRLKVLREAAKITGDNAHNRFNQLLKEITENKRTSFSRDELLTAKEAAAIVYKKNIVKQKQIVLQVKAMKTLKDDVESAFQKLKKEAEEINQTNAARKLFRLKVDEAQLRKDAYFSIFSNLSGGKGTGFYSMEITKQATERELRQKLSTITIEAGKFTTAAKVSEKSRLFYIEAFGGDSGDPQVKAMYQEYKSYLDYILKEYRLAGVDMHELTHYNIFQIHDPVALMNYGKENWIEFQMNSLNWDVMTFRDGSKIPENKRQKVLDKAFDTITTRGLSDAPEVGINETTGSIKGGKGKMKLSDELSQPRFFIYKDAEAQFNYNEKFGSADVFNTIGTLASNDASNLNMLRRMGPDPDKSYSYLEKSMIKEGIPPHKVDHVWKQWAEINPTLRDEGSTMIAGIGEALRAFSIMGKVPALIISSLPDAAYAASEKAMRDFDGQFFGKKLFAGYKNSITHSVNIVKGAIDGFDTLTKVDQVRMLGIYDAANWKMSKFVGVAESAENTTIQYNPNDSGMKKKVKNAVAFSNHQLKRVNNFHYKASFMNDFTQHNKSIIVADVLNHITMLRGKNFNELSGYYKKIFDNYGFTEKDFYNLNNFETEKYGDYDMITFNSMKNYKNMERKDAVELQRKLMGLVEVMLKRSFMEQTNLAKTAFKTGRGGSKGSIAYQAGQVVGQFKTFGITYLLERIMPMFYSKTFSEGFANATLGWLVAMPFGYAAYAMGSLINGITADTINEESYGRVAARSWLMAGGLGIFGDIIFGDFSKNGRSIIDYLAGPSGQSLISLVEGVSLLGNTIYTDPERKNLSDVNYGKKVKDLLEVATPTGDLWYLKMAKKLAFDNAINDWLNEDYREEKERQQRKLEKRDQTNFIYDFYQEL